MRVDREVRARVVLWLRRIGLLLLAVVLVEYVVLPQVLAASGDLDVLADAQPVLLVLALALETASLACFSALTRATLSPVGASAGLPRFWTLMRIDLTGYGVSHVMPGGGATAAAFRYRLLTRAGVDGDDAFAGATVQTVTALVTLIGIFLTGTTLSLGRSAAQASYVTGTVVSLALLLAIVAGAVVLTVRPQETLTLVHRLVARLPSTRATALEDAAAGLTERLHSLRHDRTLRVRTVGWGAANWLLDAACLWCCLRAFGFGGALGPMLALYGAVNLLAMLPITPGGLGIVEGVLVPALVSIGADPAVALLGVLTWRLVQYWLPIPVALITYVSLRLGVLRRSLRAVAG